MSAEHSTRVDELFVVAKGVRERILPILKPCQYFENYNVFQIPTQVLAFRLTNPDICFAFFVHLSQVDDGTCLFWAEIPFDRALDELPNRLSNFSSMPVQDPFGLRKQSLRDAVLHTVRKFYENIGVNLLQRQTRLIGADGTCDVSVLTVVGGPSDLDCNGLIDALVRHETEPSPYTPVPLFPPVGRERTAFAGRFDPHVTIGTTPTEDLRREVVLAWHGRDQWTLESPTWPAKFGDVPIFVFHSGHIVADTPHSHKALDAINALLGAASLLGLVCIPMSEPELYRMTIRERGEVGSIGGQVHVGRRIGTIDQRISEEQLTAILSLTATLSLNEKTAQFVRLRHAASTHQRCGEYLQAFVLGWAVIENWISGTWEEYLTARVADPKRLQQLRDGQEFTVHHMIEILSLSDSLGTADYAALQRLRRTRNRVIHDGVSPDPSATQECLQLATTLVNALIGRQV